GACRDRSGRFRSPGETAGGWPDGQAAQGRRIFVCEEPALEEADSARHEHRIHGREIDMPPPKRGKGKFKGKGKDKKDRGQRALFRRRKFCRFTAEKIEWVDYTAIDILK